MGGGSFSATWALEFSHCTCNQSDRVFSSYWDPCPRSAAYARGGMILWSVELPSCDALSMYWGNIMKLDKLHARREIWTRVSKKLRGYFCTWKNRTKNIIQANTEKWGGFYHFMKIPQFYPCLCSISRWSFFYEEREVLAVQYNGLNNLVFYYFGTLSFLYHPYRYSIGLDILVFYWCSIAFGMIHCYVQAKRVFGISQGKTKRFTRIIWFQQIQLRFWVY